VAALAPGRGSGTVWLVLVPGLLVAGLGGGAVVSPNMALSLDEVPPRMGGAAGGALQTGQRIGASIGAAVLMTTYQLTLGAAASGTALRVALTTGLVLLAVALLVAVRALRQENAS